MSEEEYLCCEQADSQFQSNETNVALSNLDFASLDFGFDHHLKVLLEDIFSTKSQPRKYYLSFFTHQICKKILVQIVAFRI